jgi:hypothetical protein
MGGGSLGWLGDDKHNVLPHEQVGTGIERKPGRAGHQREEPSFPLQVPGGWTKAGSRFKTVLVHIRCYEIDHINIAGFKMKEILNRMCEWMLNRFSLRFGLLHHASFKQSKIIKIPTKRFDILFLT